MSLASYIITGKYFSVIENLLLLLFSSIASASDSGSEGAQDTRSLIVVFVFCCFPVLPLPVTQVQKALRTRVS